MTNVVTPNDVPPMTDKCTGDFLEFISEHHGFQLSECVVSTKTIWNTNLRMRFSRWKQTSYIITNEAKQFH